MGRFWYGGNFTNACVGLHVTKRAVCGINSYSGSSSPFSMSCGGESVLRIEIPSSNDDRVEVDTGSESIVLLASPTGVGGVTSTGTFFLFIDPRGDLILSNERSRFVDFVVPNWRSLAASFLLLLAITILVAFSSSISESFRCLDLDLGGAGLVTREAEPEEGELMLEWGS